MSWYRTGVVSATAGQTTITGVSTNFSANARVGDAFQGPDGRWYEVTNIASPTVLTILPAYQGTTVAGGSYGLAPLQGYVKESADRLRQIVEQYGGTLALFGGAADVGTLRTNIGLGTGATANRQTSPTDIATGALMVPGAFGLGGQAIIMSSDDHLDNQRPSGLYYVTNIPGRPAGAYSGYGYLLHISLSANPEQEAVQYFTPYNNPAQRWVRTKVNKQYLPWVNITSIGTDQTWRRVVASRALNTTYTNNQGRPIQVVAFAGPCNAVNVTLITFVGGDPVARGPYSSSAGQYLSSLPVIVPDGMTYAVIAVNGSAPLLDWFELY